MSKENLPELVYPDLSINSPLDDDLLFEMVNLHKSDSKLPVNLYFTPNGAETITQHKSLRIKVQRNRSDKVDRGSLNPLVFHTTSDYGEITKIEWKGKPPKKTEISKSELDQIIKYVKDNWDTVVKHWCGEMTDKQFLLTMPSFKK